MLSSESEAEICVYPDGNKVGVFGNDLRKFLDADAELDYFAGEE